MYAINNRFDVGEECYSVYKKRVQCKCPVCEGTGRLSHEGYDFDCANCGGTGKWYWPKQEIMAVCKVKIRRLVASIWKTNITIKYKVDVIDDYPISVNNRSETTLFKTAEEAEEYCKGVNTKQVRPEF